MDRKLNHIEEIERLEFKEKGKDYTIDVLGKINEIIEKQNELIKFHNSISLQHNR